MTVYTFKQKGSKRYTAINAFTESEAWSHLKRQTSLEVYLIHTKRKDGIREPSTVLYNEILPY